MLRLLAKQLAKEEWRTYLKEARDDSYEEIMLQGLVIGYVKAEMEELFGICRSVYSENPRLVSQ